MLFYSGRVMRGEVLIELNQFWLDGAWIFNLRIMTLVITFWLKYFLRQLDFLSSPFLI